jgi:hypothetical protein
MISYIFREMPCTPLTVAMDVMCCPEMPVYYAGDNNLLISYRNRDHLCGLVVRVPGYRSRGPGLVPDATRFYEK